MKKQEELIYNFVIRNNLKQTQEIISQLEISNYSAVIIEVKIDDFTASDLPILIEFFSQKQLVVIGIRSEKQELVEFAKFSNLAIFPPLEISKSPNNQQAQTITNESDKVVEKIIEKIVEVPKECFPQKLPSIVRGNIVKNEQVYAKNCDLIILDSLGNGSEGMSDENLIIYGGGYGSAFAGIKNKNAFIFVRFFQLKLVCIAGVFRKFDEVIPDDLFNKAVVIRLIDGRLYFKALKNS